MPTGSDAREQFTKMHFTICGNRSYRRPRRRARSREEARVKSRSGVESEGIGGIAQYWRASASGRGVAQRVGVARSRFGVFTRDDLGRAALFVLFGAQWVALLLAWLTTRRLTSLPLLAMTLVVLWCVCSRRPAGGGVDAAWASRIAAIVGTYGSTLLRPDASVVAWAPDVVSSAISATGVLITSVGLLALGGSFGVFPAHRGIVQSGIYRIIRHPLYAGYLCAHIGFVLAYPSWRNLVFWAISDAAQLWRLRNEERWLTRDTAYVVYQKRVPWRLCPGVW
jgi:protein-S-isoprenylcysteine O-methyltransferase Ste14